MAPRQQLATRTYRIDDLLREGFSRRSIHYYQHRGLLPPAHGRGPSAYYTELHLTILRDIKAARDARVFQYEIAERHRRPYRRD